MRKNKKYLPTEMLKGREKVPNKACFSAQSECGISCKKEMCRYWIPSDKHYNCSIIASKEGPMTLQQIGEVFDVTRMRICQIEKTILRKLEPKTTGLI